MAAGPTRMDQQQEASCPNCRGPGEVLSSWQWIDPRRLFQQGVTAVPAPMRTDAAANTTQVNFVDTPTLNNHTQTTEFVNINTPRSVQTLSEHGTPSRHERMDLDLRGPEPQQPNFTGEGGAIPETMEFPVFAHDEDSAKTWCESDDTKLG